MRKDEECSENIPMYSLDLGPDTPQERRQTAYDKRVQSALFQKNLILEEHKCNNDEDLYKTKFASYSKALPHNSLGEVDTAAYRIWIKALNTGSPEDFESIPLGGSIKLTNPLSAYAYEMVGPDSHHLTLEPAPPFSSARQASEMVEVYWMALTRDVSFKDYFSNRLTITAARDLSKLSNFNGPKHKGKVTITTLFRDNMPGVLDGPYISQFLLKDIPFGARIVEQRYRAALKKIDFMTSYDEWLNVQNGQNPSSHLEFDSIPRYIRNGRDLGEYVHQDFSYQSVLSACLILMSLGKNALSKNNPYLFSKTQNGFVTFGGPHFLDYVSRSTRLALEAAWFQKFLVHRRIRPEEFGGRVHNYVTGKAYYPINSDLLRSKALKHVYRLFGSALLPMAYPEGCPTHTAYPSGHATFVGAGVTILKAFFNEDYIIPYPQTVSDDGLSLIPYSGNELTLGGELNKLASNIATGRIFAGVHWRTDGSEGIKLGEAVAIGILQDYKETYQEKFGSFALTKFDGTKITI